MMKVTLAKLNDYKMFKLASQTFTIYLSFPLRLKSNI